MRPLIQRFLGSMLVLSLLAGSLTLPVASTQAAEPAAASVLVEDNFTGVPAGTGASSLGYQYTAPASGTGQAETAADPGGTGSVMRLAVKGGTGGSFAELSKTFESQKGTVTFETSLLSASGTQPYLNLIGRDASGTAELFAARLSSSRGKIAFFSTKNGPADSSVAFTPGTWYNLKVEANVQTQKVSVWVDGTLIFSRIGIADSVRSIHKLQLTTSPSDGELYIRKVTVKAAPVTDTPPAPTGLYYVPRNQEIAIFWDAGVTHASQHNIKIKEKPEDPWTVTVYNKTNFLPTERTSIKKVNGTDIVNGRTYIVGVSSVLKDLDGKMYEGPTTVIEATPNDIISLPSPAGSVIGGLQVFDSYYGAKWAVKTGLHPGDAPFAERDYKVTAIPSQYEHLDWIQPSGNSQKVADKAQLAVFTARDAARVYVAMDARATLPAWLSPEAGWSEIGDTIRLEDSTYPYTMKLYRKETAVNAPVTLGLNTVDEVNAGRNIGYLVLAERKPVGLHTAPVAPWSNQRTVTVTGSVYESGVTLSVYNQKSPVAAMVLDGTAFEVDVPLNPGSNELELRAQRPGSLLYDSVTAAVYYDGIAPELQLAELPSSVKTPVVELKGSVNEAASVTVKRAGMPIAGTVTAAAYEPFTLDLPLDEGENRLIVTAEDPAGNKTVRELTVHYTFWAGTPRFINLDGRELKTLSPGMQAAAERSITNTTSKTKQIMLVVILLDSRQRMADYTAAAAEFAPGETKVLRAGFVLPSRTAGYTMKAYIWDGLDGMKPLSEEAVLR
ncbi:hypothetical protein J2T17_002646 [Paenibacillus mucilaginosus]|uniref:pectin esterase n=1 Tax=Paenibacillus mucilaginosus TaxID=61624 RepID=UPI003D229C88